MAKSKVSQAEKEFLDAMEEYEAQHPTEVRINKTFGRLITMYFEREEKYGAADKGFEKIAAMWSIILNQPVTPAQVSLCMIALKLCREANTHSADNIDDIHGYCIINEIVNNG